MLTVGWSSIETRGGEGMDGLLGFFGEGATPVVRRDVEEERVRAVLIRVWVSVDFFFLGGITP